MVRTLNEAPLSLPHRASFGGPAGPAWPPKPGGTSSS
jgi:hypothetical protein